MASNTYIKQHIDLKHCEPRDLAWSAPESTIIGVRGDNVEGLNYIAVGVKNPWGGRFHREYKVKEGRLSPNGYQVIGFGHNTKGVSWLELSDFLKSFDRLYVGRNQVKDKLHEELLDAVQKRNKRLADKRSIF